MTHYNALTTWALVIAIAVPTFLLRFSFIGLVGRFGEIPDWGKRILAFVPVAILTGLVAPNIVTIHTTVAGTFGQSKVIAGVVAIAVAYYTENVFATIAVGLGILWVCRFILPTVL